MKWKQMPFCYIYTNIFFLQVIVDILPLMQIKRWNNREKHSNLGIFAWHFVNVSLFKIDNLLNIFVHVPILRRVSAMNLLDG